MYEDNLKKQLDFETLKEIVSHIEEDISREIYQTALMYSITEAPEYALKKALLTKEGREIINQWKEKVADSGVVLFGAGVWAKEIIDVWQEIFHVNLIIDNHPSQEHLAGIPICKASEFLTHYNSEWILISSSYYYNEMYTQLIAAQIPAERIILFGEYQRKLVEKQYFDLEVMPVEKEEVFVDGGCYDGKTSEHFLKWSKTSKNQQIYAFEPDNMNLDKCKNALENLGITYQLIHKGLWNKSMELRFNESGTVGSRLDTQGEACVSVTSIDEVLDGKKVTFIKMDIEGAELEALKGAKRQICENRPKLAISIYHKANDIWEIPKLLLEYNPNYKFYLRHYSLTWADTVLYAI